MVSPQYQLCVVQVSMGKVGQLVQASKLFLVGTGGALGAGGAVVVWEADLFLERRECRYSWTAVECLPFISETASLQLIGRCGINVELYCRIEFVGRCEVLLTGEASITESS